MAEKPPPGKETSKDPGKSPDKYGAPFSLRLTAQERQALDALADGQPLGAYIKEALLERGVKPRKRGNKPVRDKAALAKLLGLLGRSRLSQNVNQLARAAHSGSLPVNEEVRSSLLESCAAIRAMRDLLLLALGLTPGGKTKENKEKPPEDHA